MVSCVSAEIDAKTVEYDGDSAEIDASSAEFDARAAEFVTTTAELMGALALALCGGMQRWLTRCGLLGGWVLLCRREKPRGEARLLTL
jgi:hypothetical protein